MRKLKSGHSCLRHPDFAAFASASFLLYSIICHVSTSFVTGTPSRVGSDSVGMPVLSSK